MSSAAATAQTIKQPGAHTRYSVDLEPHLALMWDRGPSHFVGGRYSNEGVGLGLRATIPFFHNGPIDKINNNMGIGFGLDYVYYGYDDDYYCRVNGGWWCTGPRDFSAHAFWIPVVMQWNFFVHPRIAVFGEVGFGLMHVRSRWAVPCNGNNQPWCVVSGSDTDPFEFTFSGGGRFMLSDNVGITVRLGFPQVTIGASFLL